MNKRTNEPYISTRALYNTIAKKNNCNRNFMLQEQCTKLFAKYLQNVNNTRRYTLLKATRN